MQRYLIALLLCGFGFTATALAQQKPNPQPKGQVKDAPMVDSDEPPTPSTPEQDMDIASYYIHKGDYDAAIPRLLEAIQEKPTLAKPRLMLADVYEKKGDVRAEVQCYKDYLKALPTAPDAKKIEKKIEKLSEHQAS